MRARFATLLLVLALSLAAPAADPNDILRYVPKQADAVLIVEHPRQLADALVKFDPLVQLTSFEAVKEQLDSTGFKQFRQLIAYYEKALGKSWPELLDTLAGGGACFAVHFDGEKSPALFVMKARDEAQLKKAMELVIEVSKQELERTEKLSSFRSVDYRGHTGYQIGEEAFTAWCGPVAFFSNKSEAIKLAVDLCLDGPAESVAANDLPQKAKVLLPPKPAAWIYGNLHRLHENAEAKEAYKYPKGDIGQLLIYQGIADALGKSPFIAVGAYPTADGLHTAIRMPAGRDATPDGLALHLPEAGQPGTLPLLEPKDVLMSMSFYLDAGKLWSARDKLLTDKTREEIDGANTQLGRFLGGERLGDLMTKSGTYHRFVVAHQEKAGYKIQPETVQPAAAIVSDMRDPGFYRAMNVVLRTVALVAGAQARLKMTEETIGDVKLVVYRFPEDGKLAGDFGNNRFNVSPCFAKVGNQFVVSSTVELARELIKTLQDPAVNKPSAGSPFTTRVRVYAAGAATLLKAFEDQLLTQTILDGATTVDEAKREAERFVQWVRSLGKLEVEIEYGDKEFRYDIRLKKVAHGH